MTCSHPTNCSKLSFKVALTNSTFITWVFADDSQNSFLWLWDILTVACAVGVSVSFHSRKRLKNFGLSLLWKPTETCARLSLCLFLLAFNWLLMTSCHDVEVTEVQQIDKSWQGLLGGILQNIDLCWQAFLSFLPPTPIAPFFRSLPFLVQQSYQKPRPSVFLCSENPQTHLLCRLQISWMCVLVNSGWFSLCILLYIR